MGQQLTAGLRPFLPSDAPLLAEIFREAIHVLAEDDYDAAQRDVWAGVADDEEAFAARLAGNLTLVAVVGGSAAGFASLKGADHVDMLFVHPSVANHGVGAMLLGALEKLATARGASQLTADVSDVASHLFGKLGFEAQRRETVELDGVWLGRTVMRKELAAKAAGDAQKGAPHKNSTGGRQ